MPMASEHVQRRHAAESVPLREDLIRAIELANIDDIDREILVMHYVQKKPWGYIADVAGYSLRQIVRRHKTALVKIVAVLAMQTK